MGYLGFNIENEREREKEREEITRQGSDFIVS